MKKFLLCLFSFLFISTASIGGGLIFAGCNQTHFEDAVGGGFDESQNENLDDEISSTASGYWTNSGNYSTSWSGSGTSSSPYLISNEKELAGLAYKVNSGTTYYGKYFKQTANIYLEDHYWNAIGTYSHPFKGNYDGNDFKVSGIYTQSGSSDTYSYEGLFGCVAGNSISDMALIKNVKVVNSEIKGYRYMGGIIGGTQYVNVVNCYNDATISGQYFVAGIVGYNVSSIVEGCCNNGSIKCTNNYAGGIVACNYTATIKNCYNTGSVGGAYYYAGGVAGSDYQGLIVNSYNIGQLDGWAWSGGVCGWAYDSEIANCFNFGDIIFRSGREYVGGVVGSNQSYRITNCYWKGNNYSYGIGDASDYAGYESGTTNGGSPTTKSWFTSSSNWYSTYPWDFDNIWLITPSYNNRYPIFIWQAIFKITLNKQDADESSDEVTSTIYLKYNVGFFSDSDALTSITSVTTPTRTGYTFSGYYTTVDDKGIQIIDSSGKITGSNIYTAQNGTLYAHWEANTYSDNYYYRDTSGKQKCQTLERTYDSSFKTYSSSNLATYTSNGWSLIGWASDLDSSDDDSAFDYDYEDGATVTDETYTQSTSELSWYAISERSISIKYDGNGVTYSGGNTTSTQRWNQYENQIQSVSLKVTSTTPTRKGHTFLGWSTNKSASQADYASGSTYNFNNGYSDSASVTLYAVWEINSYKVRIYAMTGISDIKQPATTWYSDNIGRYKEVSVQYGTSYTLEVAVKLAFNFDRWTYVNDNNGEIVSSNTIYNFTIEARDYTFFAFAKAKNPAYQDANGNWYVEMGEYPQSYADLVWTEYSGDGNYAGLDVSYNKNDNILTLNGSCTATTVEQTTLLSLHGLKFNEGDVYTIKREHISGSVEIQNGSGTSFVIDVIKSNGSETSTRNYNDSSVDFAGKIETKTLTINSSASAEADGFKFWIWGNTGTTIVFNNYKLKISINYDNLLNNAEKETSSSIQIANQELPVYTIKSQVGDMPTGSEFVQYENKWYKVEPVKYVLAGDYSSGFATESGNVTAVSEKVVFASIWNEEKLGLGDGFYYEGKQASINYNFQTYFFNESGLFNIREDGILQYIDNKFYYERFKDLNFGDTLVVQNGTTSTVASTREMDEVFGSGNYSAKFSDLVADILGGYLYYWTRDVGSNLNNAQTISAGGTTGTQMKMQEILGVRITVNVKTFSCL